MLIAIPLSRNSGICHEIFNLQLNTIFPKQLSRRFNRIDPGLILNRCELLPAHHLKRQTAVKHLYHVENELLILIAVRLLRLG